MSEKKKEQKPKTLTERWEAEGTGVFTVSPPSEELQKKLDAIKEKYRNKTEEK